MPSGQYIIGNVLTVSLFHTTILKLPRVKTKSLFNITFWKYLGLQCILFDALLLYLNSKQN